jgi:uncharacterized coiled-coil protein SlyX
MIAPQDFVLAADADARIKELEADIANEQRTFSNVYSALQACSIERQKLEARLREAAIILNTLTYIKERLPNPTAGAIHAFLAQPEVAAMREKQG